MQKYIVFTSVALSVLLLGSVSAQAVSLDIGGDGGLVDISTSSDTSSSGGIDVDVDLGGSQSALDIDAGVNADVGGEGDLLTLFGKPLVTTGGDALVTVDTTEDANALVTLFGTGEGASIGVDLAEGNDDEVTARLFGGAGGGVVAGVDLLDNSGGLLGGGIDPVITLFGGDDGDGSPGTDGTQTGSIGGGGGGGSGSDDGISGGTSRGVVPAARTHVAATAGAKVRASCFTPDDGQIAHLLGRASYDGAVTASWQSATGVSVVPVNLCPDARARLAAALDADANIGLLQAAVAGDARISASLRPTYDPEDVLSVDKAGDGLVVYVY